MITPTIGRKVWFWRHGSNPSDPAQQPEDATVCYVHSDTLVNLRVTDHSGIARSETSVSLRQPEHPELLAITPCAQWMPYQQGQAAKTEQLRQAIASGQPAKTDER